MKAFNLDEVNQNIMAIVSQSKDQILMSQADVSVALTSENQPLSSIKLLADISMNSLYPLTYLLFKHGTLCNRRVREVTKVLLYRTFLLAWIISTFMCIHAFSASLPFKRLMIILFIVLVSPLQIFFHGFSYRDVGFQYIYRVYGEYKRNMMVNLFNRYDLVEAFSTAGLDTVVYFLISFNLD
jgi:magnesium-transporting ATPase (P-type)